MLIYFSSVISAPHLALVTIDTATPSGGRHLHAVRIIEQVKYACIWLCSLYLHEPTKHFHALCKHCDLVTYTNRGGWANMAHAFIEKSEVAFEFIVAIPASLSLHEI
jgi:hypothetical protein